jgi:hypothetical protein
MVLCDVINATACGIKVVASVSQRSLLTLNGFSGSSAEFL